MQNFKQSVPAQPTAEAYIALGSNLGDRADHLRLATAALHQLGRVEAVSSFYETDPVGNISQPDFLNAVAELTTALQPEELLAALLRIELEQGRDRSSSPLKGPRTVDLDLLSYGDVVMETPSLTLPHPALAQRRFVLVPLVEIAPDWTHPSSGKTAVQLLGEMSRAEAFQHPTVRRIEMPT